MGKRIQTIVAQWDEVPEIDREWAIKFLRNEALSRIKHAIAAEARANPELATSHRAKANALTALTNVAAAIEERKAG